MFVFIFIYLLCGGSYLEASQNLALGHNIFQTGPSKENSPVTYVTRFLDTADSKKKNFRHLKFFFCEQ